MFEIEGKVALITGALGGIGLCFTKELLRQKIKGLSLLDVDITTSKNYLKELKEEFGKVDIIFLKTDVTITSELTDAYEKTIDHFKQLDIVINNAGIINETDAETTIKTNLISAVVSTDLAMNTYLQKYRSGDFGIVVNIASITGLLPIFTIVPHYSLTKSGLVAFGRCLGDDDMYKLKKVKILTICPGMTQTPLISDKGILPELRDTNAHQRVKEYPIQSPQYVAKSVMEIIANGKTGSVWVINNSKPAKEIDFTTIDKILLGSICNE